MYVCVCNAVTESEIRQAVELGAQSLDDLQCGLGVASNCGRCATCVHAFLPTEDHRQMSCEQSFEGEGSRAQAA